MSVRNHCPTVPVLQNPHKRKTVSPTTTPPPGNILRKIKRFPFEPPPKFFGISGISRDDLVWSFRFVTQDHTGNSLLLRWLGRVSPRLPVRRGIWESVLDISRFSGLLLAPLPLRLSWMYRWDVKRLECLAKLHPRGGTFPLAMLTRWLRLVVWRRCGVSRAVPWLRGCSLSTTLSRLCHSVGGDEADDLLQHFCCTRVHASRKHPPTNHNGRDEVHRGDCQFGRQPRLWWHHSPFVDHMKISAERSATLQNGRPVKRVTLLDLDHRCN